MDLKTNLKQIKTWTSAVNPYISIDGTGSRTVCTLWYNIAGTPAPPPRATPPMAISLIDTTLRSKL
jgi:hypothetical protein